MSLPIGVNRFRQQQTQQQYNPQAQPMNSGQITQQGFQQPNQAMLLGNQGSKSGNPIYQPQQSAMVQQNTLGGQPQY